MQQVMAMVQGLQDEMAESRAEQERMQGELHRTNEELRRGLRNNRGQRDPSETERLTPPREFSTPFSQVILEALVPNTFAGPKVIFTGMEDSEAHLTADPIGHRSQMTSAVENHVGRSQGDTWTR